MSTARKVVVINQTFQRRFLGEGDPLGRTVVLDVLKKVPDAVTDRSFQVIGVAADAMNVGLERPTEPEVWIPYSVTGSGMRRLLVRTSGRSRLDERDGAQSGVDRRSNGGIRGRRASGRVAQYVFVRTAAPRAFFCVALSRGLVCFSSRLASTASLLTPLRAARTKSAFAWPSARLRADVLKMVLKTGLALVVPGIAIGMLVSFALSRSVVSQLWGVSPYDPLSAVSVVVLLLAIGLLACWIPARRATRVSPVTALHYE